jgi:hypothetical protein
MVFVIFLLSFFGVGKKRKKPIKKKKKSKTDKNSNSVVGFKNAESDWGHVRFSNIYYVLVKYIF